jgi:thioredoxin-like negative regulator of GroEL
MDHTRTRLWALTILVAGALLAPVARAQQAEVRWRTDYNAARKEARDKGMPIVIDFYMVPCPWCDKLDQLTFREPSVAKVLREQFITLRINGEQETQLRDALRIQSYPTVVLADSEGRILETLESFKEAPRMYEALQQALARVANPEWMVRDYQEAVKAYNAPEYARAIALLKTVVQDGKARPVQAKARALLTEIEKQAAGRLARARQLGDKGQTTEAVAGLTEIVRLYPGTQEAVEAGQMLTKMVQSPEMREQQRTHRARDLLAQAKEDYRTKQYIPCLDRCEVLMASFGDLNEGAEAMQLAAEIKSNPEWMQNACDALTERLSTMYLSLADTWLQKGQPKQAQLCLERVIRTFPGSRHAEVAQDRLARLQGTPTRTVEFQKE